MTRADLNKNGKVVVDRFHTVKGTEFILVLDTNGRYPTLELYRGGSGMYVSLVNGYFLDVCSQSDIEKYIELDTRNN